MTPQEKEEFKKQIIDNLYLNIIIYLKNTEDVELGHPPVEYQNQTTMNFLDTDYVEKVIKYYLEKAVEFGEIQRNE